MFAVIIQGSGMKKSITIAWNFHKRYEMISEKNPATRAVEKIS
jgi:hypothetical protein